MSAETKTIPIGKFKQLIGIAISYQRRMRGGIAGQAMTGYTCLNCDGEFVHGNTAVPFICADCEENFVKEYQEHGDSLYNQRCNSDVE